MIEKDRATIARQQAAEAVDSDIRSGKFSSAELLARLYEYIRIWSHAVVYAGTATDGRSYQHEMETIILPKSRIVMGLSREYFGRRLRVVQRNSIQMEYRMSQRAQSKK